MTVNLVAVIARASSLRRDAALARQLTAAMVRSPTLPFKLTVALNWRCHHRCGICAIWQREKGQELTAQQWGAVFATLPDLAWLDLTGGEAPARPDFAEIVRHIRQACPRLAQVHFPTAGMIPAQAEAAAQALQWPGGPRVMVTVSFDGDPQLHDQLRGVSGAFARAAQTWQRLRAIDAIQVYAGLTLQPGNLGKWQQIAQSLAVQLPGFELEQLHVNFMHRSPHYFGNMQAQCGEDAQVIEDMRAIAAAKSQRVDPVQLIERAYLALVPRHLSNRRSPVPCRSGEISAYVAPDGTVYACTIDERPIGRLADFNYDFNALWQSDPRHALRKEIAADRCAGCWTPCEAYQTLMTQPKALAQQLLGAA
ncbi:MAG: radical SAM protein [Myxococcales bacterium]|nr:radical SAM protein [Myxococcales bacterium]